jgi:hypothetical protein
MMTRSEYMANSQQPGAFRAYHAQFVTPEVTQAVLRSIGLARILASKDPHLNDIPLHLWDRIIGFRDTMRAGTSLDTTLGCAAALRAAGDFPSCGVLVCIMKEAARQIQESHANRVQP